MIFLSAQPDEVYFLWQLEIQLDNFSGFGIRPSHFHILLGYDAQKGPHPKTLDFVAFNQHRASFYLYPDLRNSRSYVPSIRPNIIKQHALKYPEIFQGPIFYHDSDIVFTHRLPDFETLAAGDTWYTADTRSYLDSSYIKSCGEEVLDDMCRIVGIDRKKVEGNDAYAGGAQSILKNTDYHFWEKLEADAEKLFIHLEDNKRFYKEGLDKKNNNGRNDSREIQSWCADMWALIWNGWLLNKTIRISDDLDFCWPGNTPDQWDKKCVFHNAGVTEKDTHHFFKGLYNYKVPYDDDLSHVNSNSCSARYVAMIEKVTAEKKYDLTDTTFMLLVRIDTNDRLENLLASIHYLHNRFHTNILLMEVDQIPRVPKEALPGSVDYHFIPDNAPLFYREKYNNRMARMAQTDIIIKYDVDVIVPASQLKGAQVSIKYGQSDICYPYDGVFLNVTGAYRKYFLQSLDSKMLARYNNRFDMLACPSYGGAVMIKKDAYLQLGMDNEHFKGWGYEDKELHKRAKILGYKIHREEGCLYHLDHERGANSNYHDYDEMLSSQREYLNVCSMQTAELTSYVSSWNTSL